VAVAFQVVLLVGSVDVVVPQNLSVAANYACVECVTYALATQLVVSLPGPLDADGQAALADIWADLRAFGEQIQDVPLSELRDRLTEFESRILDVVQQNAGEPVDGSTTETDSDTGTTDGETATPTDSTDDGSVATSTDGSTPTTTAAPTDSAAPSSTEATTTSEAPAATTEASPAGTTEATPTG
jgi:putative peptide zinc metalloprotease protein